MTDVKRAIHDAYAFHHTKREGMGGDPVSGRLYGEALRISMGKIQAAVENQPEPRGGLLIICYAPDAVPTDANFREVRDCLVGAILSQYDVQGRTLPKLRALAEAAVIDFRRCARGFGPLSAAGICLLAGIDPANWSRGDRNWRRWWQIMGRKMDHWHRDGLVAPARVAREQQENRDAERLSAYG